MPKELIVVLAVALGAGCAMPGYRAWKQDPIGSQARENASYWQGWRVGYAEGIYATKETREEYRAKQAALDMKRVTRCGRCLLSWDTCCVKDPDERLAR